MADTANDVLTAAQAREQLDSWGERRGPQGLDSDLRGLSISPEALTELTSHAAFGTIQSLRIIGDPKKSQSIAVSDLPNSASKIELRDVELDSADLSKVGTFAMVLKKVGVPLGSTLTLSDSTHVLEIDQHELLPNEFNSLLEITISDEFSRSDTARIVEIGKKAPFLPHVTYGYPQKTLNLKQLILNQSIAEQFTSGQYKPTTTRDFRQKITPGLLEIAKSGGCSNFGANVKKHPEEMVRHLEVADNLSFVTYGLTLPKTHPIHKVCMTIAESVAAFRKDLPNLSNDISSVKGYDADVQDIIMKQRPHIYIAPQGGTSPSAA